MTSIKWMLDEQEHIQFSGLYKNVKEKMLLQWLLLPENEKTASVDSPTLSTPYLCPATWCDSGTQPLRWAWGRWPDFSLAGAPPESLTPTPAELGVNSSLPSAREDSIMTWCWVVDICKIKKRVQGLCLKTKNTYITKSSMGQYWFIYC